MSDLLRSRFISLHSVYRYSTACWAIRHGVAASYPVWRRWRRKLTPRIWTTSSSRRLWSTAVVTTTTRVVERSDLSATPYKHCLSGITLLSIHGQCVLFLIRWWQKVGIEVTDAESQSIKRQRQWPTLLEFCCSNHHGCIEECCSVLSGQLYWTTSSAVAERPRDQSCTTLDPTRGSGRVGLGQKIYGIGRVGSGPVRQEG